VKGARKRKRSAVSLVRASTLQRVNAAVQWLAQNKPSFTMLTLSSRATTVLAILATLSSLSLAAPTYRVTAISVGGGVSLDGLGISNGGHIVGAFFPPFPSNYRAYLYSNGVMQDLGTLGGSNSFGRGINAGGDVVGSYDGQNGIAGFLYSGGLTMDLHDLLDPSSQDGSIFEARGINDAGRILAMGRNESTGAYGVLLLDRVQPSAVPGPAALAPFALGALATMRKRRRKG
jgi:MYXO-CTERM domain-containing protein